MDRNSKKDDRERNQIRRFPLAITNQYVTYKRLWTKKIEDGVKTIGKPVNAICFAYDRTVMVEIQKGRNTVNNDCSWWNTVWIWHKNKYKKTKIKHTTKQEPKDEDLMKTMVLEGVRSQNSNIWGMWSLMMQNVTLWQKEE